MTADLDDDYLADWSRQRQADSARRDNLRLDHCPRCSHEFHGLPCAKFRANGCPCASSIEVA